MSDLLTGEDVMAEMDERFAAGHGNPILQEPMHRYFEKEGVIPYPVLVSLCLKKVTAYERKS